MLHYELLSLEPGGGESSWPATHQYDQYTVEISCSIKVHPPRFDQREAEKKHHLLPSSTNKSVDERNLGEWT